MKILLDENLPLKVNYDFGKDIEVFSVKDLGWQGISNGKLLKLASDNNFKVMVTMDKNIVNQQNLVKFGIKIIILKARDNRPETISAFISKVESVLISGLEKNFIEIN